MKKVLTLLMICLFPLVIQADETSKKAKIEQLFVEMDTKSIVNTIYDQMGSMSKVMASRLQIKENEMEVIKNFDMKLIKLLKQKASWEHFQKPLVELYAKNFSEKEVDDLIAFYKTPTGKKMIKKMPAISLESMQISQQIIQALYPDIQNLSTQLKTELSNLRVKEK